MTQREFRDQLKRTLRDLEHLRNHSNDNEVAYLECAIDDVEKTIDINHMKTALLERQERVDGDGIVDDDIQSAVDDEDDIANTVLPATYHRYF